MTVIEMDIDNLTAGRLVFHRKLVAAAIATELQLGNIMIVSADVMALLLASSLFAVGL